MKKPAKKEYCGGCGKEIGRIVGMKEGLRIQLNGHFRDGCTKDMQLFKEIDYKKRMCQNCADEFLVIFTAFLTTTELRGRRKS